mgnify:CR=1 FL=1
MGSSAPGARAPVGVVVTRRLAEPAERAMGDGLLPLADTLPFLPEGAVTVERILSTRPNRALGTLGRRGANPDSKRHELGQWRITDIASFLMAAPRPRP